MDERTDARPPTDGGISSRPVGVIALTILDLSAGGPFGPRAAEARILTVVRNPETNRTHPNTLSVPTQRIPESLLRDLTSRPPLDAVESAFVSNRNISGHDAVIYATESLLASKLGLADALESGAVEFEAGVGVHSTAEVHYPGEGTTAGESELISMVNLIVLLRRGNELLPGHTFAYSSLNWVPWQRLGLAASEKDVTHLLPSLDPVEICIHGLCIATSVELWDRVASRMTS